MSLIVGLGLCWLLQIKQNYSTSHPISCYKKTLGRKICRKMGKKVFRQPLAANNPLFGNPKSLNLQYKISNKRKY